MEEEKDKKGFTGRDFGSKTIPILGELESRTKEGITAAAGTIYDYAKEKFQQTINKEYGQQIESLNNSFDEVVQNDIIPRLNEAEEKVDNNIPYTIVYENQYINIPCDAYGNYTGTEDSFGTKVRLLHGNVLELLNTDDAIDDDIDDSITQYINAERSGDRTFGDIYITAAHLNYIGDYLEVPFHVKGKSGITVNGKVIFNKVKRGKSAFDIWKDEDPTNRANATPAMFILDLKNVDGVYGPKYAPDETAAISDADGSTVVYFIPNDEDSTKYDIVLVEGGEAKPLATEISGDITNYAGIYDVSEDNLNISNNPTEYPTLSDAIDDIAETAKKGGMTVKYISTDGKYHQYRYTLATLDGFNDVINWEPFDMKGTEELTSNIDVDWESGNIDKNTGEEVDSSSAFRSSPIVADKFESITVSSPNVNSTLRLYKDDSYIGSVSLGYDGGTAGISHFGANKVRVILASDARNSTTINATYLSLHMLDKINAIALNTESTDVINRNITNELIWERGGIDAEGNEVEDTTTERMRSSFFAIDGNILSCHFDMCEYGTTTVKLYHDDTYITSLRLDDNDGESGDLSTYDANKIRFVFVGKKIRQGLFASCKYIERKNSISMSVNNDDRINDIDGTLKTLKVLKTHHFPVGENNSTVYPDVYPAGTYILEVKGIGEKHSSVPSNWPDWLSVFIRKTDGETVIMNPLTYGFAESFSNKRVKFKVNESFVINPFAYYTGNIVMTFGVEKDRFDYLEERIDDIGGSGAGNVTIEDSDLELDLSTEVMDLSNKTFTKYRYNVDTNGNITQVKANNWVMIDDTIPADLGIYYVVDNNGNAKNFQLAFLDEDGVPQKVKGTSSSSALCKYYKEELDIKSLRIAVNVSSPSGLHVINGRKYTINDDVKRAAFNSKCSDGKVNVRYIGGSNLVDKVRIANKIAGEFGIVYIPSGRYEIDSTLWLGPQGQSYELASDAYIVASSNFVGDYLAVWASSIYENKDPQDQDFPKANGEDSALTNAHIFGGVFDAKSICGCLRLYKFRGFEIKGCTFYNAITKAFSVEKSGFELFMHNCYARNSYSGLQGNIAFNIETSDCHFTDLVSVNYSIGFKVVQSSGFLTRCHPWIAVINFSEYYPGSIGFDLAQSGAVTLVECYSDTMQTHYKTGYLTTMIGCTALSVSKPKFFPIENYGDVNIINNSADKVTLIGCQYRCTGTTIVKNAGTKQFTEIGCVDQYAQ